MHKTRIKSTFEPKPLIKLIYEWKNNLLTIDSKYQRQDLWKDKNSKDQLIKSIFFGYPIGTITLLRKNESADKIIDGFQRINTIDSFINGQNTYNKMSKKTSEEIINSYLEEITLDNKLGDLNAKRICNNLSRGNITLLTYKKLPSSLKDVFDKYIINVNMILGAKTKEITSFFRSLETNDKIKSNQIINSFFDNYLLKETEKYGNIESNLKLIGFNNEKKDFQKYLFMYQGIYENKLTINASDKKIFKYATNIKRNESFIKLLTKLLKDFNQINLKDKNLEKATFSKFSMKLLIGLYIFKKEGLKNKKIVQIIKMLYKFSKYNSMHNSLNNKNIPNEYKTLVNQIAVISKNTHNKVILIEALNKLLELFEKI